MYHTSHSLGSLGSCRLGCGAELGLQAGLGLPLALGLLGWGLQGWRMGHGGGPGPGPGPDPGAGPRPRLWPRRPPPHAGPSPSPSPSPPPHTNACQPRPGPAPSWPTQPSQLRVSRGRFRVSGFWSFDSGFHGVGLGFRGFADRDQLSLHTSIRGTIQLDLTSYRINHACTPRIFVSRPSQNQTTQLDLTVSVQPCSLGGTAELVLPRTTLELLYVVLTNDSA